MSPVQLVSNDSVSEEVPEEEIIWLVETSKTYLGPLELCSLESAALHHPNTTVYLLLVSPLLDSQERVHHLARSLTNIKVGRVIGLMNILYWKVRHISLPEIFSPPSPLSQLWRSGAVSSSKWPARLFNTQDTDTFKLVSSHLSDLLRFSLLYRYGGTWLDTDVICIKPLPPDRSLLTSLQFLEISCRNFVSVELESKNHLAAGVIKFQVCKLFKCYFQP